MDEALPWLSTTEPDGTVVNHYEPRPKILCGLKPQREKPWMPYPLELEMRVVWCCARCPAQDKRKYLYEETYHKARPRKGWGKREEVLYKYRDRDGVERQAMGVFLLCPACLATHDAGLTPSRFGGE